MKCFENVQQRNVTEHAQFKLRAVFIWFAYLRTHFLISISLLFMRFFSLIKTRVQCLLTPTMLIRLSVCFCFNHFIIYLFPLLNVLCTALISDLVFILKDKDPTVTGPISWTAKLFYIWWKLVLMDKAIYWFRLLSLE